MMARAEVPRVYVIGGLIGSIKEGARTRQVRGAIAGFVGL